MLPINFSAFSLSNMMSAMRPTAQNVAAFCRRNAPTMLCVFGVGCSVAASVEAVYATQRANEKIKEKEEELGRELTKWEKIGVGWPCYIGTGLTLVVGGAAALYGNSINLGRTAAALAAATAAEKKAANMENAVRERFGDNEARKITEDADKARAEEIMHGTPSVARNPEAEGLVWVVDNMFGQQFQARPEWVDRAEIAVNQFVQTRFEETSDLNDFYTTLIENGVSSDQLHTVGVGKNFGWSRDALLKIRKTWETRDTGERVMIISYPYLDLNTMSPMNTILFD